MRPGGLAEEAPFFKAPNADIYTCSVPGLGYELRKVVSDETSLDLLFMITGADPEGVMAGGGRPPAATIVESDGAVAVRLWYVTLAPGTEEAITAFSSSAARLKSAFWVDGYLELEFSVSWKYAVTLVGEEGEPKPGDRSQGLGGYRLSFLPKPEEPTSGATSLHDVAAAISGVDRDSMGDTPETVAQRYLLALSMKDWRTAYECLGIVPDGMTLSGFIRDAKRSRDARISYIVEGYEMGQQDAACVYVPGTSRSGPAAPSSWKETWPCIRVDGVWKLRRDK